MEKIIRKNISLMDSFDWLIIKRMGGVKQQCLKYLIKKTVWTEEVSKIRLYERNTKFYREGHVRVIGIVECIKDFDVETDAGMCGETYIYKIKKGSRFQLEEYKNGRQGVYIGCAPGGLGHFLITPSKKQF